MLTRERTLKTIFSEPLHFLEVFLAFVTILLLFVFWGFGHEACGILASQPGLKTAPPTPEGQSLEHRTPGKPLVTHPRESRNSLPSTKCWGSQTSSCLHRPYVVLAARVTPPPAGPRHLLLCLPFTGRIVPSL